MQELKKIQEKLKVSKDLVNEYAGFKYRSAEVILENVKPLLLENDCQLVLTDDLVNFGDRYYVKATATISNDKESVSVSAFAREALLKKGMDESQITGSASSYARKYALNGLFLIDDGKDADTMDNREEGRKKEIKKQYVQKPKMTMSNINKSLLTKYIAKKLGLETHFLTKEDAYQYLGSRGVEPNKELTEEDAKDILTMFQKEDLVN